MKNYQILEHKADLKIRVKGKSKEELFKNSMIAMLEAGGYQAEKEAKEKKLRIYLTSFDFPSLLIDFLNETLYLVETKKLVFHKIDFQKLKDTEIQAILTGKKLKRIDTHIKSVTHHGLEVKEKKNKEFEATVLFDI